MWSQCRQLAVDVMGVCTSCCPREDDSAQGGGLDAYGTDRLRLIDDDADPLATSIGTDADDAPNGGSLVGHDSYMNVGGNGRYSTSLPKSKRNEEQAALQDIVSNMVGNVIDVSMAHATHTLEPTDYQERAHEYGRRLHVVAAQLARKHAAVKKDAAGLVDSTCGDRLLSSADILSSNDTLLIAEVASRAQEAAAEFHVEHVPDLVGIFGAINPPTTVQQTDDINGGKVSVDQEHLDHDMEVAVA